MRLFVVTIAMVAVGLLVLAGAPAAEEKAEYKYIGVDGCKMCHKSEKSGNQYGIWLESAHAKAYEVLASDEAKALVEGKNPQEMAECLACHVTGHGAKAELLDKKYKIEDGVGCESCHGPGSAYKSNKVMKDHDAAVAAGMIVPTKELCVTCHNEKSPTYKAFDYEKAVAAIAHPTPKAEGK